MNVLIGIPNWRLLIKEEAASFLLKPEIQLIVNKTGRIADRVFLEENICLADAYIAGSERVDRALLERAPRLRVIARYGVGIDNVDVAYATEKGIYVTTTAGANANAVAEHTVVLILAAFRRLKYYVKAVEVGQWTTSEFPELTGKTVGLIGFGRIGRLVARRLSGFEVRLLVCDPFQSESVVREAGGRKCAIETLLRESDVVSLHLPASREDKPLLGAPELALMKRGAYLVNTSRGTLIDEQALAETLKSGRIAGAALDVVTEEPCRPDHPLLSCENVMITPHIAGGSYENHVKAGEVCVQAVLDGMRGIRPVHAVNEL